MTITTTMTWGDGEDVTITIDDLPFLLYENPTSLKSFKYGVVNSGSLQLTAEEALELSGQLSQAAHGALELDQMCRDHDDVMERGEIEY